MGLIEFPKFMLVLKELSEDESLIMNDMHYKLHITYSHGSRIKNELVNLKIIDIEKDGVRKKIKLTEKGKQACLLAKQFIDLIQNESNDKTNTF